VTPTRASASADIDIKRPIRERSARISEHAPGANNTDSLAKMYPKRFTFDPVTVARARLVTLRAPNLNVLLPENRAKMPGIAHFLEGGFKTRDKDGKLLLPDLRASLSSR
jgi:hypothetical protein